ncbi:MAG: hypothetical protein ACRED9_01600 [Caulobacteraceae bacterium]
MSSGSRRQFMQITGAAGLTFISSSGHAASFALDDAPPLRPNVLPSANELRRQNIQMNNLGVRFTGNDAHRAHLEYLVKGLQARGLNVQRDTRTFTRWLATNWAAKLTASGGVAIDIPATSYYPYSGATGPEGVTGELVKLEQIPFAFTPSPSGYRRREIAAPGDLNGKVVFIEVAGRPSPLGHGSGPPWGFNPEGAQFPTHISALWGGITPGFLGDLKKAGVVGAILGWTNVSDAQAHGQYTPYGRPFQDLPCVWVGKQSVAKLRGAAGSGAKATVILQADIAPNVPVDTLYAVLPGMSSDSVLIVESHSDGMNFLEENGSLGILALAKYFSQQPKESRKRDIVFVIANHFAREDLIGIFAWIRNHPDIIKKAAAFVTLEHLGCREWFDNAAGQYVPSGKEEMSYAITDFKDPAGAMLESAKDGSNRLAVIRGPLVPGEGGPLYRAGVPGIAYFPAPNYLLSFADNGHIDKYSHTFMHAQIENLARAIHKLDGMSAEQIRAS